jgi:sugar phosphate isomerase/epimerase
MDATAIHPRISINGISTREWTLEQDTAFHQSAGIEVVNIPYFKFSSDVPAAIDAIRAAGLRGSALVGGIPTSLIDGGSKTLEALKPVIDTASALDCPSFYVVTGPTPSRMPTDEAYRALVESLAPANAYARKKGVRLAIENNSTSTRDTGFIHTLVDAVDLARDADIGICLELQNCWLECHLERLFKQNVDLFTIVQVSDYLVGEPVRLNRRVPGDGSIPLEWLLERLLDAGYEGYFDIEIVGPSIEAEGYVSAVGRSIDWLSERLRSWGV